MSAGPSADVSGLPLVHPVEHGLNDFWGGIRSSLYASADSTVSQASLQSDGLIRNSEQHASSPYLFLKEHEPARILETLKPGSHPMQQWEVRLNADNDRYELWMPKQFVMGNETATEAENPSSERAWRWLLAPNIRTLCTLMIETKPEDLVRIGWADMFAVFFPSGGLLSVCTEVEFASLMVKERRKYFIKHPLTQTRRLISDDPNTSKRTGYTKSDLTIYTMDTSWLSHRPGRRQVFWWEVKLDELELLKAFLQGAWKLLLGSELSGGRFAGIASGEAFRRMAIDDEGRLGIDMDSSTTIFDDSNRGSGVTLEQFISGGGWKKTEYPWSLAPDRAEMTPGNRIFYEYCVMIGRSVMAEHRDPNNLLQRAVLFTPKQLADAKLQLEAPNRKFKRKREDEGSGGQPPAPSGGGDKGGSGGQGGRSQGSSRGGKKGGTGEPTSGGTDAEPRRAQGGPSDATADAADGETSSNGSNISHHLLTPQSQQTSNNPRIVSSGDSDLSGLPLPKRGMQPVKSSMTNENMLVQSDGLEDNEVMDEEDLEMFELIKHIKIFPWASLVFANKS